MCERPQRSTSREVTVQDDGLVRSIAMKIWNSIGRLVPLEDLIGYGQIGLLEAKTRYDADRNVRFSTFAYYRIRGAILDGLRTMADLPRSVQLHIRVQHKMADYLESNLSNPLDSRGTSPLWRELQQILRDVEVIYCCTVDEGDADASENDPADIILRKQLTERVQAGVDQLPDKDRRLIRMVYFEDLTLSEAGKRLGLSRSWACRLHRRILRRLYTHIMGGQPKRTRLKNSLQVR